MKEDRSAFYWSYRLQMAWKSSPYNYKGVGNDTEGKPDQNTNFLTYNLAMWQICMHYACITVRLFIFGGWARLRFGTPNTQKMHKLDKSMGTEFYPTIFVLFRIYCNYIYIYINFQFSYRKNINFILFTCIFLINYRK